MIIKLKTPYKISSRDEFCHWFRLRDSNNVPIGEISAIIRDRPTNVSAIFTFDVTRSGNSLITYLKLPSVRNSRLYTGVSDETRIFVEEKLYKILSSCIWFDSTEEYDIYDVKWIVEDDWSF